MIELNNVRVEKSVIEDAIGEYISAEDLVGWLCGDIQWAAKNLDSYDVQKLKELIELYVESINKGITMMESIMSAYVIDIGRLVKGVDKRLFSGRSNGEDAFKHFSLNKATPNDTVELLVPEDVVISSSYFLGMLEKIMRMYPSVDEYKKHVDESRLKGNNLKEYHRALKRGFHKNVGLF